MENTSPFLFDNIDQRYFLAIEGKAVGPLTAQEIYERIQKGQVGLLNYLWRENWSDWKRVCDEREFAVVIPKKPAQESIEEVREALAKRAPKRKASQASAPPVAPDEERNFYIYFNRTQYGPFSRPELKHVLKSGKLTRQGSYLWTPGWPTWRRLSELEEFAHYLPAADTKSQKQETARAKKEKTTESSDRRKMPRRPLVARLFLHNNEDVIIAVCRDISVGGMQVLTDRIPGPVGSTIKLNVSPGDPSRVQSFVAEGEIVRLLEDGRGFSFRFIKISEEARKAISKYIKAEA